MWKIVKAELSYLKPAILISGGFFVAISLTNCLSQATTHDFMRFAFKMLPRIILVHLIVNFALLYLEVKEQRLRQLIHLPLPVTQIGIARLLTPGTLLVIYMLLYVICFAILLTKSPSQVLTVLSFEYHHQTQHGMFDSWYMPQDHWYMPVDQIYILAGGLFLTYVFRLFSESYGRLLLLICVFIVLVQGGVTHILKPKFLWVIADFVYYLFHPPLGTFVPLLLAIGLSCVIHLSFMYRKSYMW